MPAHLPCAPTRTVCPSAETPRITATAVVRPGGHHSSEPPPPQTMCWHCGETTIARVPEGWATAWLGTAAPMNDPHAFGVCPACLDAWATLRNSDI